MSTFSSRPSGRELGLLWLIAALLSAAVLGGGAALLLRDVPPSEAFYEHNSARLEDFAARTADGAIGVVMLGDSRLRYGTETEEELGRRLSESIGSDVAVVRLVNNWAVYEDFEPLVPLIHAADPDLVVLQEELLVKDRAADASALIRREYLLWRLFGSGPWNPGELDQVALQVEMRCEVLTDETVEQRRERVFRWVDFDTEGTNAGKVVDFVAGLDRAGIDLEYLGVPITTAGDAGLPGFEPAPDHAALSPDVAIADADFCDVVHMNPEGRAAYTTWLVSALSPRLER